MTYSAGASRQELPCQAEEVTLVLQPAFKPLFYIMQVAIFLLGTLKPQCIIYGRKEVL
jgi:hypothetical protein